jgi:tight adherence protein B
MIALATLLVAASVASLVYALAGRSANAQVAVDSRLRRASGQQQAVTMVDEGPALRGSRMSRSANLSRTLERVRSLQAIGSLIERSGWRLSVVEFLAVTIVTAVLGALLGSSLVSSTFLIPGAAVGVIVPFFLLRRAVKKRRDKFVKQLIDALTLMANALKAGVGLMQAIDQASDQMKAPLSVEFKRTLRDVQLGATPDDAFMALNERVRSGDLDIVLTAIIVQRATGGNLAEILETTGTTMRDRIKLLGEVKTLTSQQQLSGYLVGCMPIALLVLFYLMNHSYVAPLFTLPMGHVFLGVGGALELVGFMIIRKIVSIEV